MFEYEQMRDRLREIDKEILKCELLIKNLKKKEVKSDGDKKRRIVAARLNTASEGPANDHLNSLTRDEEAGGMSDMINSTDLALPAAGTVGDCSATA